MADRLIRIREQNQSLGNMRHVGSARIRHLTEGETRMTGRVIWGFAFAGAAIARATAWRQVHELIDGAGDGIRTRDLKLGKLVLYQLSYTRGR